MLVRSIFGLSVFGLLALAGCSSAQEKSGETSAASSTCVSGSDAKSAFDDYVTQTGGIEGSGIQRSPIFTTTSADGKNYKTVCRERRKLEYHPQNSCQYLVQGGLIGRDRAATKYPNGFPSSYQTGQGTEKIAGSDFLVRPEFKAKWEETGGVEQNGLPISNYFYEKSEEQPGQSFLVQYFERAVFELHDEAVDNRYRVQGKLLGNYDDQCSAATLAANVNIRLAAFIPGSKEGSSDIACERVDFGQFFVSGAVGGIFNVNERGYSYNRAMTDSKLATNVTIDDQAHILEPTRQNFVTMTCSYNNPGPAAFPEDGIFGNKWCVKASTNPGTNTNPECDKWCGAPAIACKRQDDNLDMGVSEVYAIPAHEDGRYGVHAKVKVKAADPLVMWGTGLGLNIDGNCTVETYFDPHSHKPIDIYATCDHKAFPSYELYVAGVQVMTHTAFGHSPGDLAPVTTMMEDKHHCERKPLNPANDEGLGEWTCDRVSSN